MAIHFLQSKAAKHPEPRCKVFRMTEIEAETAFRKIRWSETDGEPVCPDCGGVEPYEFRRPTGLLRFRCKACGKNFTITSGTLFAAHKAPLRDLSGRYRGLHERSEGQERAGALPRSRHVAQGLLGSLHKVREAMAEEFQGPQDRRRGQGGGNGWRVFRRLRPPGQLQGEPPRPSPLR